MINPESLRVFNEGCNENAIKYIYEGQRRVLVPISLISSVSSSAAQVFEKLGRPYPSGSINLKEKAVSLKEKARALQSSFQELQHEKDNLTKNTAINKFFCVFRVALAAGIIAGGILGVSALAASGAVFSPIGFGFAAFLTLYALCCFNILKLGVDLRSLGGDLAGFGIVIAGPFFPIYELFQKIPSIEGRVRKEKKEFERELASFAKGFDELQNFSESDCGHLRRDLKQKLQKIEQDLRLLSMLATRTQKGESELQKEKERYEKALTELETIKSDYAKLNAMMNAMRQVQK